MPNMEIRGQIEVLRNNEKLKDDIWLYYSLVYILPVSNEDGIKLIVKKFGVNQFQYIRQAKIQCQ